MPATRGVGKVVVLEVGGTSAGSGGVASLGTEGTKLGKEGTTLGTEGTTLGTEGTTRDSVGISPRTGGTDSI